jgi:hypothetical protein
MGVLVNYALMFSVGFADLVSKMVCSLESSYLFGIRNKAHTIFIISHVINNFHHVTPINRFIFTTTAILMCVSITSLI